MFKSPKAGGCTKFSADIETGGEERPRTTCIRWRLSNVNDVLQIRRNETLQGYRMPEEIAASPRSLDPSGYRFSDHPVIYFLLSFSLCNIICQLRADVAVYYDDCFAREFGNQTVTRIYAIMAVVNEMYSEEDSLKTTIQWNIKAIQHWNDTWCNSMEWKSLMEWYYPGIARDSGLDMDAFIFLTGSDTIGGGYGLAADIGTTCSSDKGERVNVNRYGGADAANKGMDASTAEVR